MELKDTIEMMQSADYKERFIAEYKQTKIRYEKLKAFNNRIEAGRRTENERKVLVPLHDCPDDLLREQQSIMGQYLHILEVRAVIEGIDLECKPKLTGIFRPDCKTCRYANNIGDHEWECICDQYDLENFSCYLPIKT